MKRRGSFTIEASLLLPIIIFSMATAVQKAVEYHVCVREAAQVREEYTAFSPEKLIYTLRFADAVKNEIGD